MTTTGQEPPGCVAIPVLIVVVPLRLLWEVLAAVGRFVGAYVLRPIGIALHYVFVRPLVWLLNAIGWALAWLWGVVLWPPLRWLLRVLVWIPLRWVVMEILVPVARFLWRYVLRPFGVSLAWMLVMLLRPFVWLGRGLAALWGLLWPGLVAFGRLIAYCWRLAGIVLFHVFVRPVVWAWQTLVMPVLRVIAAVWRAVVVPAARWFGSRVWEPARAAARSVSRALGLDTRSR